MNTEPLSTAAAGVIVAAALLSSGYYGAGEADRKPRPRNVCIHHPEAHSPTPCGVGKDPPSIEGPGLTESAAFKDASGKLALHNVHKRHQAPCFIAVDLAPDVEKFESVPARRPGGP
ncbi:hypothetical protein AB6813_05890 [bacterium RCC_150]